MRYGSVTAFNLQWPYFVLAEQQKGVVHLIDCNESANDAFMYFRFRDDKFETTDLEPREETRCMLTYITEDSELLILLYKDGGYCLH